MAIELKEYVGHLSVSVNQKPTKLTDMTEGNVETYVDPNSLMVDIEAIHSKVTRNNTYYSPECLKQSVRYWTYPYERPVIMHHNERDGQIIGRVKAVEYKEAGTRSGTPGLVFTANIGNEEGKKGVKDGTLCTVSIGVIAHDLRCSICGTNLAEEGMCEHEKGEVYEDKLCYWIINKMEPKEVSYVIVPSDIYAHNIRVYDAVKKNKSEVKEKMEDFNPFQDLIESTKNLIDTNEGTQVDEEVKTGAETAEPNKEEPVKDDSKTEEPTKKEPEAKEDEKPEENKTPESTEKEEASKEEGEEPAKEEPKKEDEESKEDEKEEEDKSEDEKTSEELEAANAKIADLEKEVKTLKAENDKLKNKADNEKKLKEAAELKLVEYQAKEKKSLIEQINTTRLSLSLETEDEAVLIESSEDSLQATLKQLNEFASVQKKIFGMHTLTSPIAVSEEKDNTSKENNKVTDVKESTEDSNNSLEDEYINLFKNIF